MILLSVFIPLIAGAGDEDPYLWLEEVEGEKALEWVKARSAKDTAEIEAAPEFAAIHAELLEIFNSRERIPNPAIRGAWLYNFWQDAEHVRGVWRRTFLDQYLVESPAWEIVLDVDALAAAEGENWVWEGASFLPPDYRRCLVTLSRGGSDASVVREFDSATKTFVADGFFVPEAKSNVAWKDADTVWIGTDFGEGSLTTSGYPRIAKEWKRGTPLASARTVFEGEVGDVSVGATSTYTPEGRYDLVYRTPEFYRGTQYLILGERLVKIDVPEDANLNGIFKDHLLVSLRSDWTVGGATYPQDALLAIDLDAFLAGSRAFTVLFEPGERVSLAGVSSTRNHLLLSTLDNVRGRLYRLTPGPDGWANEEIPLPGLGNAGVGSTSDDDDTFFFTYNDFLTPPSLYLVRDGQAPVQVKTTPAFFDTAGMQVAQYEATSKDGTRIPYFLFTPSGYTANGENPTLLYGYGGFEIPMEPGYSAATGKAWVGRGGVYALANIRGGGEFGPKWHQAAVKEKHQTAFDDFIAVAEDLIARKITSPRRLGIVGGSNGGLLVGACMVQRPDLFEAVVCQVPLLDMKRYSKLLAGASWMAEYGDPDTADWEYIKTWSPYHNVDAARDYPRAFFYTSTRDDRVHPGHARKMVAKLTDLKKPVYYYENTEGGHGVAANLNQRAYMWALTYAYLWKMLR
ncbi:MAG TPA: prolyl oligopeptidase family serine peptidase [Candidatus Krumholzibacteria bacterium]|nr:prolyl oligopeptidase family serine peptidase [Candidatus Krumholzibacteria bacterium]HPD70146.1 prolyl oligopeptidase family serine peptidase [Candidatus Krumholzibacteria bacterium]HRY40154.1 prolyl oligopeptidase family serine peptidase [Candidatus Krumholzibacteria bacterium]